VDPAADQFQFEVPELNPERAIRPVPRSVHLSLPDPVCTGRPEPAGSDRLERTAQFRNGLPSQWMSRSPLNIRTRFRAAAFALATISSSVPVNGAASSSSYW